LVETLLGWNVLFSLSLHIPMIFVSAAAVTQMLLFFTAAHEEFEIQSVCFCVMCIVQLE